MGYRLATARGLWAAGRKATLLAELIKVEHTVFALPFAYLGALLAAGGLPTGREVWWITVAMVAARTAAMCLNRLIDRTLDALNPRTAGRALPRGLLRTGEVWALALVALAVLFWAALMLNRLCLYLLPVAVAVLVVYPYTKRWTWGCHWILGGADGLAPLGAWVAVRGVVDGPSLWLWAAVAAWVAGFDIVYACQDIEFDRRYGLHSLPARFGPRIALTWAKINHVAVPLLLAAAGVAAGAGAWYLAGVALSAGLLAYEHRLVSPVDFSRLNYAFLNVNGYLSVLMFGFALADRILAQG
ncbi:MAG: UbiA-like polyprenyltransferase [Clostridia bacterium]|jgi:4-hydroxybenzoate polyprenyltransferase|nr:putative 4-hydroxybenzoate polyprenyltransferase [Clostridia bacterium]MDH7573414.1 UbiA-like polyprenyltransferase [Clostridia bacterium]